MFINFEETIAQVLFQQNQYKIITVWNNYKWVVEIVKKYLQILFKSASVNYFKTIWICCIFSVIPMPASKRNKEDLHRAGKAPSQTKLTFLKKIKII